MKRVALALAAALLVGLVAAQDDEQEPRGLITSAEEAFVGYTLVAPLSSTRIRLLDLAGEVVHEWETSHPTGNTQLLANGNLLCAGEAPEPNPRFEGPGVDGGLLQEIDWEGNVVWQYILNDDYQLLHHDVDRLPNGNLLFLAWEHRFKEDAIEWGRDPAQVGEQGLWVDAVFEIEPTGPEGGEIVWEWHVWDHIVQDFDPDKANHGSVPDHPGRIDMNADHRGLPPLSLAEQETRQEIEEQMAALGYGGESAEEEPAAGPRRGTAPDWLHTNALTYDAEHDLIVLSTPNLNELWVIDHSTTSDQAAGSTGGRHGQGGEILWRWGNPRNYGAGSVGDQQLFFQHDPTWVSGTAPGELRLLVFNNGRDRPDGDYSTVDELVLPFDPETGFAREAGKAFGPAEPVWTYRLPEDCYSSFISGTRRLPNGNTLICSGAPGRILEVTPDGRIVWDYENVHGGDAQLRTNSPPPRTSLYRASRVSPDHPGLAGRLGR